MIDPVDNNISGGDAAEDKASGATVRRRRRFAALAILAVVLLGGGIGGLATHAFAGPFGWGMRGHDGPMDPAEVAKHVERRVKHFCVDIDCKPDQQAKLVDIAQGLAKDVGPMRQELRRTHQQVMDILAAPTIDRNALEQLRTQQLQRFDAASKRFTQAMADAAEVLTPEQREQAVKHFEHFRERMHQRG